MNTNRWAKLYEHGRRRGGAIHPSDGARVGLSEAAVRAKARREGWLHRYPDRSVFLLPGSEGLLRAETSAALLAVGQPAWLARETAAVMLQMTNVLSATPVKILVPHGQHRYNAPGFELHESRRIAPHDVTVLDGQPLTTAGRTLADLSAVYHLNRVRHLAITGRRRGTLKDGELALQLECMGRGCRGTGTLRRLATELAHEQPDSGLEFDARGCLKHAGFRLYPRPFPYRCDDGIINHLDIVIDGTWVCIECDHPFTHTSESTFHTDRLRWNQITRHWQVVWIDAHRLETDPDGFIRDVQDAVRRSAGLPPPVPAPCRCRTCRS